MSNDEIIFSKANVAAQGVVVREGEPPRGTKARTFLFAGEIASMTPLVIAGIHQGDFSRIAFPLVGIIIGSTMFFASPDDETKKLQGETTIERFRYALNSPEAQNVHFRTAAKLPFQLMSAVSHLIMGLLDSRERLLTGVATAYHFRAQLGYIIPPKKENALAEMMDDSASAEGPVFAKPKVTAAGIVYRLRESIARIPDDIKATGAVVLLYASPLAVEGGRRMCGGDRSGMGLLVSSVLYAAVSVGNCIYRMNKMTVEKSAGANK